MRSKKERTKLEVKHPAKLREQAYTGACTTQPLTMAAAAEHVLAPFMAGCRRIRQFAFEHHLTDRPHSLLWLAKHMHSRQACMHVRYGALGT